MKTPSTLPEYHLTQQDLDRVTGPEQTDSLPMRCHQEDCFIYSSELDASPQETTPAISLQPINSRP